MPTLVRDLRLAARRLLRAPSLVAIVLVTVGAGTGANAVVASAARTLLFDPPPGLTAPDQLVQVFGVDPRGGYIGATPAMADALEASGLVDGVAAIRDRGHVILDVGPQLADLSVAAVSSEAFETLGLQPAAGRLFVATDAPAAVAVIAHELWAGSGDGIGRLEVGDHIELLGETRVIVGAMPRHFTGLRFGTSVGVWTPMAPREAHASSPASERWQLVARVAGPAAGLMPAIEDALAEVHDGGVSVQPFSRLAPGVRPRVARIVGVLLGATLLVLLVACVNAGAMMLSRGMSRARELAIRQSLGAGRRHLVRELLSESVCLAAGAAFVGLLFTMWASAIVPSMLGLGRDAMPVTGAATLGAIALAVLLAGVLLSVGPLLQGLRPANLGALRSSSASQATGAHGASTRAALVVTQVALSSVLLVLSIVLTGTLHDALWSYPTVPVRDYTAIGVRTGGSEDRLKTLAAVAADRETVAEGAWTTTLPAGRPGLSNFEVPGADGGAVARDLPVTVVTANYFDVMRMPVIDGRGFMAGDTFRSPLVAVVNDVMAGVLFNGNAVGQQIATTQPPQRTFTIVGVVRSTAYRTLEGPPQPMVYYTTRQMPSDLMVFVAPTAGGAAAASSAVARAWTDGDLVQRLEWVSTMDARLSSSLPADRATTTLLRAATMLAGLLITIGVYGVMADTVARRQREIGVCAALGAGPSRIVTLVLTGGVRLAGIGVVAGLAAGVGAWRVLGASLEGTAALEVRAVVTTIGVVLVMSVLAALVPAQRALRVDPLVVMREE